MACRGSFYEVEAAQIRGLDPAGSCLEGDAVLRLDGSEAARLERDVARRPRSEAPGNDRVAAEAFVDQAVRRVCVFRSANTNCAGTRSARATS